MRQVVKRNELRANEDKFRENVQNEMHERLCQDYKEQQAVVLAEILELEKPLAGDSSEICNKIIGPTTDNFKHKIKVSQLYFRTEYNFKRRSDYAAIVFHNFLIYCFSSLSFCNAANFNSKLFFSGVREPNERERRVSEKESQSLERI